MTVYLVDGNNYSHLRHGRVDPATDSEVIRTVADFAVRRTLLRTQTEIRLFLDSGAHPDLELPLVTVRVAEPGTTADSLIVAEMDYLASKKIDCVVISADAALQSEAQDRRVPVRHPSDFVLEMIDTAQAYRQRTGRSTPPPDLAAGIRRPAPPPPAQASIGQVLQEKARSNPRRDAGEPAPPPAALPEDILARTRAFLRPEPAVVPAAPAPEPEPLPPGPVTRFALAWSGWSSAEARRLLAGIHCPEHEAQIRAVADLLGEAPGAQLVDPDLLAEVLPALRGHCSQRPGFTHTGTAQERILRTLLAAPESGMSLAEIAAQARLKEKDVRHKVLGGLAGRVQAVES